MTTTPARDHPSPYTALILLFSLLYVAPMAHVSQDWSLYLSVPFRLSHPPPPRPAATVSFSVSVSLFWLVFQFEINCGSLSSMPNVVFEINGKKYPLPASAYTSQVGVSGLGCRVGLGGNPRLTRALRPPGGSAKLVVSGGPRWRMQDVCLDQLALLRGALWSWAACVAAAASSWEKWGRWGGQRPGFEGGGGRATDPVGASVHCFSASAQGPRLSGMFLDRLGLWGPRFPVTGLDLILSTPTSKASGPQAALAGRQGRRS